MKIGVLGLGRMGAALAGRLLEQGHDIVVWNRSPGRAGELVEAGAKEAESVAGAAGSVEVAVTVLSDDAAVRAVALGDEGILASLPDGGIHVDCSTISPALTEELAAVAGPEWFASAPILGAPMAVRSGRATYLAGGRASVLDRLEPMLSSLAASVRRYELPSQAAAAKLASNLMLLAGVAALAESFAVGRAGGLTDDQLRQLLSESPMVAAGVRNRFEGILAGGQDPWWTTTLGAKDAGLAAALAQSAGVGTPVAEAVRSRFAEAARRGYDEDDIAIVGQLYGSTLTPI